MLAVHKVGGTFDAGEWWDSRWHSRLVLLTFMGLHLGYLKDQDLKGPVGTRAKTIALGPEGKGPTEQGGGGHQDAAGILRLGEECGAHRHDHHEQPQAAQRPKDDEHRPGAIEALAWVAGWPLEVPWCHL